MAAKLISPFLSHPFLSHPFLLMKLLPNVKIKSHTIITANAAPHLTLSRAIAPVISFVTDARAVEVLGISGFAMPADESFSATGVSFFTEGCTAAALGSSSAFFGGFRENAGQLGNVYRYPPRLIASSATSQLTPGLINVAFLCEQLLN
jgi:hypothetical protein